jgi:hypothetical protein
MTGYCIFIQLFSKAPARAGLVFGGPLGETSSHTIYAGSADDPSWFKPGMAIFVRNLPSWVVVPPGLEQYEALPP